MEEDGEDASNGSGDVWDESLEAPFWIALAAWIWSDMDDFGREAVKLVATLWMPLVGSQQIQ